MAEKILVIDDDPDIAKLINLILKPRGLQTYHAVDGQDGLKQAYELQPDLIILDIMMPDHDGYEICARLRELSDVPILMLTAKSQGSDVTHGFAVGADDYVKKPFSNDELVSRIESLLRRKKSPDASANITKYSDGVLDVELASQKVKLQGEEISFTPTEFKLLSFLIKHPQKTLSPRNLLAEVWGNAYTSDKSLLSLFIHQLRQKLKDGERDHKYIQTQWGQGYWFNPLPQVHKSVPEPTPESEHIPESEPIREEQVKQENAIKSSANQRWVWFFLAVPILLLALQLGSDSGLFSKPAAGSTTIGVIVTADGFVDDQLTGVHGQVCVSNQGKYPTENLSIMSTVQAKDEPQDTFVSTIVDLGQYPTINPDDSHCFPYEIIFEPAADKNVEYRNIISITITNYSGLEVGSEHCPGPYSCAFGPTTTTYFVLPE